MVWSRAATSIPTMRPLNTTMIWRWERATREGGEAAGTPTGGVPAVSPSPVWSTVPMMSRAGRGDNRLRSLGRADLQLDVHPVADQDAAGLEGPVPREPEVLPVDR